MERNTTKAKNKTKKILQKKKREKVQRILTLKIYVTDRTSNTWQPIKSRLQNKILTASVAQEIEEDGNKNRRQKGSGERQ